MEKQHALAIWRKSQSPKVTQEAIAEMLGLSRWYINRIEKFERVPSLKAVLKVEALTGGSVTAKDFKVLEASE